MWIKQTSRPFQRGAALPVCSGRQVQAGLGCNDTRALSAWWQHSVAERNLWLGAGGGFIHFSGSPGGLR